MPTVIIRPDASSASSGFDQSGSNLASRISDNDTSTFVTNTSSTSNFTVSFNNSDVYSGATINNVVVSITGNTVNVKVPEASVEVSLRDASSVLQTSTLTFTPTESTENGAEYSTSLTPSVVDSFILSATAETVGLFIKEVFITVDYTAAAITLPYIGMKSGKYKIINGKIKI